MYTDAETQLDRIIGLAGRCPDEYRVACFEILLQGYVDKAVGRGQGAAPRGEDPNRAGDGEGEKGDVAPPLSAGASEATGGQIPQELVARFRSTAKRLGVPLSALEALFDFAAEPFDFHALSIPGKDNSDKARKVVLVVAARSYLTRGTWVADWKEVKSQCVNQNCYDRANFASTFKKGLGGSYKNVEVGDRIELSGAGIKEAEVLLTTLASGAE